MRTKSLISSAAVAALSLFSSATAHAQDDEEIVVTATRAAARVATLPAEVDVIDVETAQSRGVTTLANALREAPGLDVVPAGGAGQQTSLFAGGANSNHTLVLFDGLRINDPSTPGSSFDAGQDLLGGLSRIEVVQGPMSAVFGSDALGGVVNLIPRHGGPGVFNARLNIAGGSLDTWSGGASVDGTLGSFRYAVSADAFSTGGYDLVPERMSTHTGEHDGAEMTTLTGVFDFSVSNAFALDLLVRHREAHVDFDPFLDFFPLPMQRAEDDNLEISQNDLDLARLGATWTLGDALSMRATIGGMHQQRAQSDDGQVTDAFDGRRRFADLTLTWRPGAVGAFDGVNFVAGISAEHEEISVAQGFGFPPPSFFTAADQTNGGLFVSAQSRVDRLTLTGAVRVDDYQGFGTTPTWRLGASFDAVEWLRLYAAYGASFRAPTLYERFVSFGNPNLDPERGKGWEVGANARFHAFGQAEGIELAGLYRHSDIDDLIDFGPLFTYANVDRATIDTAEARLAARPFEWLTARVAYVYTDAHDDVAHTPLLRRPKNYWTAELIATHGPFRADLSWREVGQRSDQIYGDDGFALGIGETPSFAVTRLSLAYDITSGAEVYVAADNLFDAAYEPANAFAGAPRTFTLGLRTRY
ncbi:MAG: TonB-dependent receptor [Vitreimonas sp.]